MNPSSRRNFIKTAGLAATVPLVAAAPEQAPKKMKNVFIHHVYFWMKNPGNAADLKALIEGLTKLSKVKTIKAHHIGVPAATSRDVIDGSYGISWMTTFKNAADQDSYQVDPVHLKFIEENSHLWSKVIVYDSVDA